ncbi:unnamed protein product [Urochloa decumbens]|uniref:F-box associated beta-propeller type 3 domain-containing protein n=1 Tax=Urochloa decumbens TaxID=240449 RepID=A0ABC8VWZ2_9POAL
MRLRSGRSVGLDEKRRRTLAAAIPDDLLIYEVLVHLPAKSLARCKCVRRSWRTAITGAAFVRHHLKLSRARPPSSSPSLVRATPTTTTPRLLRSASTASHSYRRRGITRWILPTHCDGLVAIATVSDRVFVCNPATREFVALPPGIHNAELHHSEMLPPPVGIGVSDTAKFWLPAYRRYRPLGFDQWRNRYVVARYFFRTCDGAVAGDHHSQAAANNDMGVMGHEVFTLGGGGGSWELTQDPPHAVGVQRPICTRRALYWHADEPQPRLMRFGLQDRAFAVVPRPPAGWSPHDDMAILDGKLCYVYADSEAASFHFWLAEDAPDLKWSLQFSIEIVQESSPDANPIHYLAPVTTNGDKVLLVAVGRYSSYLLSWCTVAASNDGAVVEQAVDLHHELRYGRPDGSKYMGCQSQEFLHCVLPYFESLVSLTACNY